MEPKEWQDAEFEIRVWTGFHGESKMKTVKGQRLGAHLGIHEKNGFWNVTHIPTGYAISSCQSEVHARSLTEKIVHLNWDGLYHEVLDITKKIIDEVNVAYHENLMSECES